MSSGASLALGIALGIMLATAFYLGARRRGPLAPKPQVKELSAETRSRAQALVAQGKPIQAIKAVRAETGWDLKRAKAEVDALSRPPGMIEG